LQIPYEIYTIKNEKTIKNLNEQSNSNFYPKIFVKSAFLASEQDLLKYIFSN